MSDSANGDYHLLGLLLVRGPVPVCYLLCQKYILLFSLIQSHTPSVNESNHKNHESNRKNHSGNFLNTSLSTASHTTEDFNNQANSPDLVSMACTRNLQIIDISKKET